MYQKWTRWKPWFALAVLVGAVLLLAIDGTVLYLAVPSLTADLNATSSQVLWVGDIYSLVLAGLLVTMGNLADRIGRKKLLILGSFAFGFASIIAATASSAEILILARLLLGIAGATIMPSTLSLIRNIFTDPAERTRAIAIWSAASASGVALGPLIGGALLENFWWGSVFLINLPVMVLVIVFGTLLLPESRNSSPGKFDIVSSLLSMLTIIPFVYTIKQIAGGKVGWMTLIAVIASVIGAVLFIRRQRRSTAPMIDVSLFRVPAFNGAVMVGFVAIFAMSGALFFFSQYLQLARGLSPLQAGLAELPIALASMVAVAAVGFLLGKLGRGRAIALSLFVGAVGMVLLSELEDSEQLIWVLLALIPLGLGVGIAQTLAVDAVVSAAPKEKAGAASSISETAFELGVALGIAILGSLMTVFYRLHLVLPSDISDDIAAQAEDSLATAVHVLTPASEALAQAQHAFVSAMQTTTLIGGGIMVLAAVMAFFLIPSDERAVKVKQ